MASLMRQTPGTPYSPPKLVLSLLHHHPLTSIISFPTQRNNPTNLTLSLCRCSSPMTVPSSPKKKRTKYRKQYPGESVGITEEMRFVAMRLRNANGKKVDPANDKEQEGEDGDELEGETWSPSKEGFLNFLVDSKLVFDTIERIVDESEDVSYAYFRRTGLERCESLEKDLEWFRTTQGLAIPEPSQVGVSYAKYLEEEAKENAALFLSHFYSIYFSHIAGGQVIIKRRKLIC
uniref:Heme oxygenase-2 n=1 Tax=Brassica juncea TaxID=3707 RepID=G9FS87_BRAJU|nr:heme oxygenase-2 [Brassica juncea]